MNFATGLFTRTKYNNNQIINTEMNTTTPAKPLTYDLVELVIHFDDNNTESMIVSLDSFAHEAVKDYAKVNGYKLDCLTPDESTLVV
jgi:hypothetical protein